MDTSTGIIVNLQKPEMPADPRLQVLGREIHAGGLESLWVQRGPKNSVAFDRPMRSLARVLRCVLCAFILCGALLHADEGDRGKHLFILSGQSNMVALKPEISFTPLVTAAFGQANVLIVKDAHGAQSIRSWCKENLENPPPTAGKIPKVRGALYETLMKKVHSAIEGKKIETISFIWMQGESDLRNREYRNYLDALLHQLEEELKTKRIYFVLGRISDSGLDSEKNMKAVLNIRKAQVEFAESSDLRGWVDTDDLNDIEKDGKTSNDIHYHQAGLKILGERFAEKVIALIQGDPGHQKENGTIPSPSGRGLYGKRRR